jgi:hypothetical protein
MDETGSLSHTKWECKYHVVFISITAAGQALAAGACASVEPFPTWSPLYAGEPQSDIDDRAVHVLV